MSRIFAKISFVSLACLLFFGCERNGPSPVDMRIDDAAASGTHVVTNNETLYDIAYRYNVDPINLAKINGLQPPYVIRNGQVLQLPSGDSQTGIVVTKSGTTASAATGGYVAIDETVNNSEENDIPPYLEEQEKGKKKKDESDDDFDSMILAESDSSKGAEASKKAAKSASSAKALATPKVTATAVGTPVSNSQKTSSSAKGEKSSVELSSQDRDKKNSKMRMPVQGKIISHFGDVNDGISNDGINIRAKKGTNVSAAADGTVIYVGNKLDEEYGNVVIIQHDNGLITSYAHLDKANVKKDTHVHAGDKIGTVGNTGDVKEPQLYFEVMKDKKPVNPSKYLKK